MAQPVEPSPAAVSGPRGLALVEESIQFLRQVPLSWWTLYLAGTVPWVVGWFWTWSRWVWMQPGPGEQAWLALLMVGLFFWLKGMQAECATRLLAWRYGRTAVPWSWGRWYRRAHAQFRVHAWGLIVLPLLALATIPFAWGMAFYQNLTVLADEKDAVEQAQNRCRDWPMQNHLGLLGISIAAAVVWINLASCFYAVPWLANRFLGIENLFALRGIALLNSTFWLVVTAIAWLAVDPLIKAFYTLRIFYGRSRREAGDLRVELSEVLRKRGIAMLVLGTLMFGAWANPAEADSDTNVQPSNEVATAAPTDAEIVDALDRVLSHPDFTWSLPPPPADEIANAEDSWVDQVIRSGQDLVKNVWQTLRRWGRQFSEWVDSWSKSDASPVVRDEDPDNAPGEGWNILLYVILIAIIALLVVLVWVAIRRGRNAAGMSYLATAITAPVVPDLTDERVHAAQLPWDRWLAMARECMEKGDWRLAWRALFLAQLAWLGAEEWLELNPAKTNLDYERELMARLPPDSALAATFRTRRRGFEGVWYGRSDVDPAAAEQWWSELNDAEPSVMATATGNGGDA